ncbi:DUF2141 domain-containing protein [Tenacibaculum agarivorans]|uniref:DUF2141 domain-containing protein n=1 Tax=Tenacibaculum agarivorans TaxID=1908389 RepID=UPI00094BA925|nr:DUF2141 domain-containing protein [Tenacibaculum agarivorans]
MKTLATILISMLIVTSISAQETKQTITVTVVNATSDKGTIKFALFTKATFLVKEPLQAKEGKIKDGKTTIVFENVPTGEYAVTCYHDKNGNNKMDFEPNGMPMEAYGASNNVMNFEPPRYDDAKFTILDKDVSLDIKL